MFRKGLHHLIEETTDMVVVGEANGGDDALEKIRTEKIDIVLLDISMQDKSGIDVLNQLKREKRKAAVLMLSVHEEGPYIKRAMEAGASGYLSKYSASEELINAIREISTGGTYISPSLMQQLAVSLALGTLQIHKSLSKRELEIMRRIGSGKTVSGIARELLLSVKTVSTHRRNILEKLSMKTNSELMYYSMKNHLLDE
jgi:two-component system invasion response regulator UvrY